MSSHPCFNSTKVRLLPIKSNISDFLLRFQFYKSTIITLYEGGGVVIPIVVSILQKYDYYGRGYCGHSVIIMFQFYKSTIITEVTRMLGDTAASFNSTKVRLLRPSSSKFGTKQPVSILQKYDYY